MQAKTSPLESSARFIKGVGPNRLKILNRLGIFTVSDLFYYFPRRYEDRSQIRPISRLKVGDLETVKGEVLTLGVHQTKKKISIFELAIGDDTGIIYATWFNQPYMKKRFKRGDRVILSGRIEYYKKLQLIVTDYEIITSAGLATVHTGRIVPIYPLTQDLNQRAIRTIIKNGLDKYSRYIIDTLPIPLRKSYNLPELRSSLWNIHFPLNFDYQEKSRERLVFEEFFLLQMALALRKFQRKDTLTGIQHQINSEDIADFERLLPYDLTAAQKKVISQVREDMQSPKPMNRLIQGDVGSGKTAVAIYALLLTIQNGYQGVIMVPTEVLAEQHYINFNELLLPLNINIVLLINGLSPAARRKTLAEIASGEANIIIGTHALIQEKVEYKNPGLVIIDEQHKFGVNQRALLKQKASVPDCLIMTATPIPRTLALTLYGDLDISVIDELPKGRKAVATYWISDHQKNQAYEFIREQVKKGRQAYIVYPLVEKSEKLALASAVENKMRLQNEIFREFKVGLIHGRMNGKEKERILINFKARKIDILASTTVIEVGIDIPDASVMLIENAERFGLAQLHQLRGRVGRSQITSYCILSSDTQGLEASQRLKTMTATADGFVIAESDLEIRGPGEFFGTRQHGLPELKLANLTKDIGLLESSREEAIRLVTKDPRLSKPENRLLKDSLIKKFKHADNWRHS